MLLTTAAAPACAIAARYGDRAHTYWFSSLRGAITSTLNWRTAKWEPSPRDVHLAGADSQLFAACRLAAIGLGAGQLSLALFTDQETVAGTFGDRARSSSTT